MLSERRKAARRQADRDMIRELAELRGDRSEDASREHRHLRRRAIRHNCKAQIALKITHASGLNDTWSVEQFPLSGRILDLSPEGCSLFSAQQIDIGQELSILIGMRNGGKIRAGGAVRWTKAVREHNGFASGVQFTQIAPGDRQLINQFLKELDESIGL